jgi:hypothetical protein
VSVVKQAPRGKWVLPALKGRLAKLERLVPLDPREIGVLRANPGLRGIKVYRVYKANKATLDDKVTQVKPVHSACRVFRANWVIKANKVKSDNRGLKVFRASQARRATEEHKVCQVWQDSKVTQGISGQSAIRVFRASRVNKASKVKSDSRGLKVFRAS